MCRSKAACCPLVLFLLAAWTVSARIDREDAFVGYSELYAVSKDHVDPEKKREPGDIQSGSQQACNDLESACGDWAAKGECEKNPDYMQTSCAKSCDGCARATLERMRAEQRYAAYLEGPKEHLVVATSHGEIRVRLRSDLAPQTVTQVKSLVNQNQCRASSFHRSETYPKPGVIDMYGGPGPPYALLQGSFRQWKAVHKEEAPLVERGMVCLIQGGPDWFVALSSHHEWLHGFTVWGEVDNMTVVEHIVTTEPVRKGHSGQVTVSSLVNPIPYTCHIE
ncbi:hypothetical protein CYMTET_26606 [Cymbomonas tetramitiformis]|uniref:ShKT domain-containing protein n=1 Tax=Cymbomonas tetramitiformis TaxID=36881 RepID=A0AAE0FS54_9CHLO|nr:hypothetical protein CYMTET_26606 [Cymbomonas tetramitiformis]